MTFLIGVPTETPPGEQRVATLPDAVENLRLSRDTQEGPIDKQTFVGETLLAWSDQADQLLINMPQVAG